MEARRVKKSHITRVTDTTVRGETMKMKATSILDDVIGAETTKARVTEEAIERNMMTEAKDERRDEIRVLRPKA